MPWAYDDEAVDVVRFFTKLKLSLVPYLYSSAVVTSMTGVPMMRSMVLEFEKDHCCKYLDRQYMLGDSLLVAPIFNDQSMADYYLPEGKWSNYFTGEIREGSVWCEESHDYMSIPLWVKENSIIPVCENLKKAADSFKENITLKIFGLEDKAEIVVYQEQESIMKFAAKRNGQNILCKAETEYGYNIRFVNCILSTVQGGELSIEGNDSVVTVKDPCAEIVCEISV